MTLTIQSERDEQRQLLVTVEVAESRVEEMMRKLARQLARQMNIPGFRRGKAPYRVVVRRVGRDALRAEAVEELVPEIFEEVMEDVDEEEVYGQPQLDDLEVNPLVLHFVIPLQPDVELGEYRHMRREIEPVEITEEAVDEAVEQVQIKHQELEDVDRPIEEGDLVTIGGMGWLVNPPDTDGAEEEEEEETAVAEAEGDESPTQPEADTEPGTEEDEFDEDEWDDAEWEDEEWDDEEWEDEEWEDDIDDSQILFSQERLDLPMDPEKVFPGTPFVENLLGLAAGDEAEFTFTFPEDYEDEELAGEEAAFELTILNVQSRDLPPINDELAQLEGDYETLQELRVDLRQSLRQEAENQAKDELIGDMTDRLQEQAEVVYPPAAVDMELDNLLENFKQQAQRSGWTWDDYLTMQGLNEEMIRDQFRDTAVEQLENRLVLRQLILNEKITVEAEDIDAAVEDRVSKFDNPELQESMRDYFRQGQGFDAISGQILQGKVYERIKDIFSGTAPDLAELEEETDESEAAEEEE